MVEYIEKDKAIEAVLDLHVDHRVSWKDAVIDTLAAIPSTLSETELRKTGEWDMFELISSAWYGKQYYFKQDNGMVYSRASGKMMTEDDAVKEFLRGISDE